LKTSTLCPLNALPESVPKIFPSHVSQKIKKWQGFILPKKQIKKSYSSGFPDDQTDKSLRPLLPTIKTDLFRVIRKLTSLSDPSYPFSSQ